MELYQLFDGVVTNLVQFYDFLFKFFYGNCIYMEQRTNPEQCYAHSVDKLFWCLHVAFCALLWVKDWCLICWMQILIQCLCLYCFVVSWWILFRWALNHSGISKWSLFGFRHFAVLIGIKKDGGTFQNEPMDWFCKSQLLFFLILGQNLLRIFICIR